MNKWQRADDQQQQQQQLRQ